MSPIEIRYLERNLSTGFVGDMNLLYNYCALIVHDLSKRQITRTEFESWYADYLRRQSGGEVL